MPKSSIFRSNLSRESPWSLWQLNAPLRYICSFKANTNVLLAPCSNFWDKICKFLSWNSGPLICSTSSRVLYWPQRLKWKLTFFFKFALLAFPTFIKISNQVETHWVSLIFSFFWYFSRLRHTQVIHKLFNTFWKPLFNNFICVCILYLVLWWTFLYNYSQIFQRLSFLKNVWKDKNSWIYKNAYFF